MIKSFGCAKTEAVFNQESIKGFPAEILKPAYRKMLRLETAPNVNELRIPPANHLEKLKGDQDGFWSIRVNDQYRIIFKWDDGAHDVRIVDYH